MSIQDDFKAYTDQFGLIQPTPGQTSGNGLLYTAEAIAALSDNNALDLSFKNQFIQAYANCEVFLGLLKRTPDGQMGQEGPDDYHGAMLASIYLPVLQLSRVILEYGQRTKIQFDSQYETSGLKLWSRLAYLLLSLGGLRNVTRVYNNVNPGYFTLSSWLGRFPALFAGLKYASGRTPNPIEFFFWTVGMFFTPSKDNHDAWIMDWCHYRVAKERTVLGKPILWFWNYKFRKVWGNPGNLFAAYFANPNHPIAIYLQNS